MGHYSKLVLYSGLLALMLTLFVADGRQMCWSCQYVTNGRGEECATAPANWTQGDPRTRCEGYCIIMADFDSVTGLPTYFFRGCVPEKSTEDGCEEMGTVRHHCVFTCGDGDHYCNDMPLPRSPIVGDDDGSGASGLSAFLRETLVVVCVVLSSLLLFV